jgi:hypothetical protein
MVAGIRESLLGQRHADAEHLMFATAELQKNR